jgi:hypothetical protein
MASQTQLNCPHLHVSKVAAHSKMTENTWRCDVCKLLLKGELRPLEIVVSYPQGGASQ